MRFGIRYCCEAHAVSYIVVMNVVTTLFFSIADGPEPSLPPGENPPPPAGAPPGSAQHGRQAKAQLAKLLYREFFCRYEL